MEFETHVQMQKLFSEETFGPGANAQRIVNHVKTEIEEILLDPSDLKEWIDIIILGIDGAWRAGYTPRQVAQALEEKQKINRMRQWPDWRTVPNDQPIEHVRG